MSERLTPDDILYAYQMGYFPMAEPDDGEIYWHSPDPRAVMPLQKIKVPRSVRKSIKKYNYIFRVNSAFEQVIRACADREETWISEEIIELYTELNRMGFSHSVETWHDNKLVGGLYGISINAAFFGESMFTKMEDSSKAAFYHLVERLKKKKYLLLDSQYINIHTKNLGAIEVTREQYMILLDRALKIPRNFDD